MSHLTKEQLRETLSSQGVELPPQSVRKEELISLFRETNPEVDADGEVLFSDDDEQHQASVAKKVSVSSKKSSQSSRKSAGSKQDTPAADNSVLNEYNSLLVDGEDISKLTDDQLFERLREFGVDVGPIVESTRSLYQKKLAILIRGESDTQNGDQGNQPTNGFDQYSADEDTEEEQTSPPEKEEKETEEDEDEQPAPVVTRTTPKLEEESQNKSNLSLRQRFSWGKDRQERFTPTPRRSIHSYKVTETSRRTLTKSPDGNLEHDYVYRKETYDSQRDGKWTTKQNFFRLLPWTFLFIALMATAYYLVKHMDSERMTRCLSYFSMPSDFMQSEAPEVEAEVAALDPPPRESLDEQPSVANV